QGLQRDWGADTAPLGLLLGCAFPPLTPRHDWQHRALAALGTEGLTVARRREGVLGRLTRAASDLSDADRALSGLRRAVWAERARIALRELLPLELGGASVDVTAKELSHLAEAALEVVLAEASQHVRRRFGTPLKSDGRPSELLSLGMGKLGGQELNAGSDVDLIFIYDTDDGQSELPLHEHWSRVVRRAVARRHDLAGRFAAPARGVAWRRRQLDGRGRALLRDLGQALGTRRHAARAHGGWQRRARRDARARAHRAVRVPPRRRAGDRDGAGRAARALTRRALPEPGARPEARSGGHTRGGVLRAGAAALLGRARAERAGAGAGARARAFGGARPGERP